MSGYPKKYELYKREYNIWAMMKQRCNNPKAANYVGYGAKGVRVDPRWDRFEQFIADLGPAPTPLHTLDRIDNNLGYSPENCRWADVETQQNNRTNGRHYPYKGQMVSAPQLARIAGVRDWAMAHRLKVMGLTPEQALAYQKGSWVQRRVICKSLGGCEERCFDSLAHAAKTHTVEGGSVDITRKRLWAAIKHGRPHLGFLWEYAA